MSEWFNESLIRAEFGTKTTEIYKIILERDFEPHTAILFLLFLLWKDMVKVIHMIVCCSEFSKSHLFNSWMNHHTKICNLLIEKHPVVGANYMNEWFCDSLIKILVTCHHPLAKLCNLQKLQRNTSEKSQCWLLYQHSCSIWGPELGLPNCIMSYILSFQLAFVTVK